MLLSPSLNIWNIRLGWQIRIVDQNSRLGLQIRMVDQDGMMREEVYQNGRLGLQIRIVDQDCRLGWQIRMVDQDGRLGWQIRIVDQDSRLGWQITMVDQEGRLGWYIKIIDQDGRFGWQIRMEDQDGRLGWQIRIVQQNSRIEQYNRIVEQNSRIEQCGKYIRIYLFFIFHKFVKKIIHEFISQIFIRINQTEHINTVNILYFLIFDYILTHLTSATLFSSISRVSSFILGAYSSSTISSSFSEDSVEKVTTSLRLKTKYVFEQIQNTFFGRVKEACTGSLKTIFVEAFSKYLVCIIH